ncbi:MAG: 50S ribosomal protein L31e [Candidatus Aenigmarchaeota archaeon]|nr:50S ribosomal protein L31e [Candidatus Aenigmarchaeota archaeon]
MEKENIEKKEEEKEKKEESKVEEEKIKEEKKKVEEVGIFVIPLRKAFRKTRNKRAKYAINLIKDFLERRLKSKNIKIGKHLNEKIWERGIEKPPRRVKVKVSKVDEEYRAELFGYEYEEFKLEEFEKKEEGLKEKLMQRLGPKAIKKQKEEEMIKG